MKTNSSTAIYAAIAGNFALTVTKFVVAAITGSAAMLSEGIHSLVDTGNGGLLLLGVRLSKRPPDKDHPFGHGLELYFWAVIVALLIFGIGGGMSAYEGIVHILNPREINEYFWIYVVLGCGVLFEGISWVFAVRTFLKAKGERGVWETIHNTKDPTIFAVLLEDSAALVGLVIAFAGIGLGQWLENPYFDGLASILIGLILMGVATILAWESKTLLIGEGADPKMVSEIQAMVERDPEVQNAKRPLTMHFGPRDVLVNLDVQFRSDLTGAEIELAVDRLERQIRTRFPVVQRIFLETRSISRKPLSNGVESQ